MKCPHTIDSCSVKQLWCVLAEETVTGLPVETVAALPELLETVSDNVDNRRRNPLGRRARSSRGPTH